MFRKGEKGSGAGGKKPPGGKEKQGVLGERKRPGYGIEKAGRVLRERMHTRKKREQTP